jgi:hypothetical protein
MQSRQKVCMHVEVVVGSVNGMLRRQFNAMVEAVLSDSLQNKKKLTDRRSISGKRLVGQHIILCDILARFEFGEST